VGKATYRIIVSIFVLSLLATCLLGCTWGQTTNPFMGGGPWTPNPPSTDGSPALGVLNWTAGLSIIGGVVAMVLGSRRTGLMAIAVGCGLIGLSYVMAVYAHLILLPIGIVLSIISAIWGYKTITKAWRQRT